MVLLQRVPGGGKVVARIERVVSKKLEDVSLELVRPRFGDNIHYAADGVAVLRAHVPGLHVEFLNRIRIGEGQVRVHVSVVVVGAVHLVVNPVRPAAINRSILFTGINSALTARAAIIRRDVVRPGDEEHQALRHASIQGQILDVLLAY